jgi:hypothetical protein
MSKALPLLSGAALAALLTAPAPAQAASASAQKVGVGARPAYAFRAPLLNGRGVRSLADLAGRPTLIEFWGTH